jgi:hypothetical protein
MKNKRFITYTLLDPVALIRGHRVVSVMVRKRRYTIVGLIT